MWEAEQGERKAVVLPLLGRTLPVLRLPGSRGPIWLLATPGRNPVGVQFLAVTLCQGTAPGAIWPVPIFLIHPGAERSDREIELMAAQLPEGTVEDDGLSVVGRRINIPGAFLVEVSVTEGQAHGVFLVALHEASDPGNIRAEALRLATDVPDHVGCGKSASPWNAVALQWHETP